VNCFRLAATAAFRPVTAAVAAVTAVVAAGCAAQTARPAADPQQTSIVVAAVPAEGAAGLYIAAEEGLFARAGLRVTIKTIEDPRQRALQTALHLSPQVVAVMAAGTFPTALDPVQIQRAADLMLRYGQLRRPFAVASVTGP
jgi:ABC-type nitrate/sulfonate/bicarbonate transport system substrate-binding protein